MRIGVIGGTGADKPEMLSDVRDIYVKTIFGDVVAYSGKLDCEEVVFLARHSSGHTVAPHRINYRANIAALKVLGVERIIATAAVGSLNQSMPPGCFRNPGPVYRQYMGKAGPVLRRGGMGRHAP